MQYNRLDIMSLPKRGRLTIIKENLQKKENGIRYVDVLCDCGIQKTIRLSNYKHGNTWSCGCLNIENVKISNTKHSQSRDYLYKRWDNIKKRCFYKKGKDYLKYGAKGITMCDEWKNDYTKFRDWALANGYKPELQIDRINNNGNYQPNNCRWVTTRQNINNRSNTIYLVYNGKKDSLMNWARFLKVNKISTFRNRIKCWGVAKTFETYLKK
jgi:hypothetical protein